MRTFSLHCTVAILIAGALAFSSCIDEDYSLENLDTTVTVLPGLSITVDTTVDVPLSDILEEGEEGPVSVTENGSYAIDGSCWRGNDFEIPAEVFKESSAISIPNEFLFSHYVLPQYGGGLIRMHSPICIEVENPTDEELEMRAVVNGKNKRIEVSGIMLKPGKQTVTLDDEAVKELFCPFDSDVIVDNIVLYRKSAGSPAVKTLGTPSSYVFSFNAELPMVFRAGDGLEFIYHTDVMDESGVIDAIEDTGMDVTSFELQLSITSTLPFDITLSANTQSEQGDGSITLDKTIAAGSLGHPVTTDLNLIAKLPYGINSLLSIGTELSAIVPSTVKGDVTLTKDYSITLNTYKISLDEGFSYSL